jgi:hypothetical protein
MGIAPSALDKPNSPIDEILYLRSRHTPKILFALNWCKKYQIDEHEQFIIHMFVKALYGEALWKILRLV